MAAILEVIYGPNFDIIHEKHMVYVNNDYVDSYIPLKLLEESIAACIGLGIAKYVKFQKITNPFGKMKINITKEEIHIHTNMIEKDLDKFVEICKNCYITNHLTFHCKIINNISHDFQPHETIIEL